MTSPGGMDRWLALEVGRLNEGLVVEKKSLARLLSENPPVCRTRSGEEHRFDRSWLERLASVLSEEETERLRLPITLFVSGDMADAAYLTDAVGAKALRALESLGSAFPYREGRMFLPHSLAFDLVRRSGGTLQLAFG